MSARRVVHELAGEELTSDDADAAADLGHATIQLSEENGRYFATQPGSEHIGAADTLGYAITKYIEAVEWSDDDALVVSPSE